MLPAVLRHVWHSPLMRIYFGLLNAFRGLKENVRKKNRRQRAIAVQVYEILMQRMGELDLLAHQTLLYNRWFEVNHLHFELTAGIPLFAWDLDLPSIDALCVPADAETTDAPETTLDESSGVEATDAPHASSSSVEEGVRTIIGITQESRRRLDLGKVTRVV